MYAIVKTGGKQYKVEKGDILEVEKIDAQPGESVELDVIMINTGKKVITDAEELAAAKVTVEVLEQFKGKKQMVFKFHKRKRYHRTKGHRQELTKVEVTKVPRGPRASKSATTAE